MPTFLIVMTALTLVVANYLIWRQPNDLKKPWFVILWTVILTYSFCMLSPLLLFQGLGVALAALGLTVPRYGKPIASTLTIVACVAVWGYMAYGGYDHWQKVDELQAEFPVMSFEERLPEPQVRGGVNKERFNELESGVIRNTDYGWGPDYFQRLHDAHAKSFARTPGFGPTRMLRSVSVSVWAADEMRRRTAAPQLIPQPGPISDGLDPSGDDWPPAKVRELFGFHVGSVGNFVNAKGFGYFKSRREVVGFASHGFESEPKPPAAYRLERLELVGVVLHPRPVVYVSEFLPRMADLGTLATRPADDFEAAGLAKFAAGEDLTATAVGTKVRLLGAIRNLAQCVDCHGGNRGDLLGAFSYRLAEWPRPPLP